MKIASRWGFGNTNKRNYFIIILRFDYNGGMRGIRICKAYSIGRMFKNWFYLTGKKNCNILVIIII